MSENDIYDSMIDCIKTAQDLPAGDIRSAIGFLAVGEWDLTLDFLSYQLYEHDVVLPEEGRALFLRMGEVLGVDVPALMDPVAQA